MARYATITTEQYNALITAFRKYPGRFREAAKEANCTPRAAQRAWLRAWPRIPGQDVPIQSIIAKDKEREAVEVAERRVVHRTQAISQVTNTAVGMTALCGRLVGTLIPLVERVRQQLESTNLSTREMIDMFRIVSSVVKETAATVETVKNFELEPIPAHSEQATKELDHNSAVAELRAISSILSRGISGS